MEYEDYYNSWLTNHYISLLLQGLDPSLSHVEAALTMYEREEGPMLDRVSHIKNSF